MSVHKDNRTNTWYVKYQNRTKRGFKYKKEALAYEAKMMLDFGATSKTIWFYELIDEYLTFKKTDVQYTTYLKYKEGIEIVMKPNFPNKPIDKITIHDCDLFKARVQDLDYSSNYKNKLMTQFKGIFNYAVRRNYISANPATLLKGYKKSAKEIADEKARENSVWSFDEFNQFIECVDGSDYKALFLTLFTTGIRLGEALALCWMDLCDSTLSITKSHTKQTEAGSYEIKIPKSNSSVRLVQINDSLNNYLLEMKDKKQKEDKNFSEGDFIFGGKKPLARTSIDRRKEAAIKASGVKRIRIHDFRHSHASILINNGMNIVAVSHRLGHSDVNMTLKIYTHLLENKDQKILDFIENSSHYSSQNRG